MSHEFMALGAHNKMQLGPKARLGFQWGMPRRVEPFKSLRPGWIPGAMGKDERLFKKWHRRTAANIKTWAACKLWHRLHGTPHR